MNSFDLATAETTCGQTAIVFLGTQEETPQISELRRICEDFGSKIAKSEKGICVVCPKKSARDLKMETGELLNGMIVGGIKNLNIPLEVTICK